MIGVDQALAMAINREVLVEKVTRGGELPAYGIVPDRIRQVVPGHPPPTMIETVGMSGSGSEWRPSWRFDSMPSAPRRLRPQ
jgi:ABC-type transport system substrate-binding protein